MTVSHGLIRIDTFRTISVRHVTRVGIGRFGGGSGPTVALAGMAAVAGAVALYYYVAPLFEWVALVIGTIGAMAFLFGLTHAASGGGYEVVRIELASGEVDVFRAANPAQAMGIKAAIEEAASLTYEE